jgi:hypothetical protein
MAAPTCSAPIPVTIRKADGTTVAATWIPFNQQTGRAG